MADLNWEEPPAPANSRGKNLRYAETVEELKKHPGRWAVVAEDSAPTIVGYLKTAYGVEATARGVKDGRASKIYARWPASA